MNPLIVANWKMNPSTLVKARELFNGVKKGIKTVKKVKVVICPPFLLLSQFLYPSRKLNTIKLGAQDCFWEEKGAFTGEASPKILKDLGAEYVILGHSERRKYFAESDEMVNKKIKAALKVKLKPIFCIGETQSEREKNKTQMVLGYQIEKGLNKISKPEIKNIILAYEPVWAIGTGNFCDIDTALNTNLFLQKFLAKFYSRSIAENLPILYGGSVDSKNARGFLQEADFQGLLVGKASLNLKEFTTLVKEVSKT